MNLKIQLSISNSASDIRQLAARPEARAMTLETAKQPVVSTNADILLTRVFSAFSVPFGKKYQQHTERQHATKGVKEIEHILQNAQ